MQYKKTRGFVLACLFFLGAAVAQAESPTPAATTSVAGQKVFVCGHSFHVIIAEPLAEFGKAAKFDGAELVGQQFIGGSRVAQHWDLADSKEKCKKALKTGKVDVLTLSPMPFLPDEGIDKFTELALECNPKARILIQASWFPYDGPTPPPGFKNPLRDQANIDAIDTGCQPFHDKMVSQVNELNAKYQPTQNRSVVYLVPVGLAVSNLRRKVVAGEAPGISKQSELFRDDLGHGKAPIVALAAYCHYGVIYKQSPVGLPVPAVLSKEKEAEKLNKLLQELSWAAVNAEPLAGVAPAKTDAPK